MSTAEKYGSWAVIAGGSEGVGAAFARQLGREGINVVLVARQEAVLTEVAQEVKAMSGVQVRTVVGDLTRPDMLDKVVAATDDIEVGLLVCNAGASHGTGPFLDATLEDALRLIRLNPVVQVSLAHHFGRKMATRGRGGIILVGSLAGNAGGPGVATYCGAKAFTQVFAEALWTELRPLGIDVLCVVLGATKTPARARLGYRDVPGQIVSDPDDIARECLANLANGPVLVPSHLEEAFRTLCSLPRRAAAEAMRDTLAAAKGPSEPSFK